MENKAFLDYTGETVNAGDTGIILSKDYGFQCLRNAELLTAKYLGFENRSYHFLIHRNSGITVKVGKRNFSFVKKEIKFDFEEDTHEV